MTDDTYTAEQDGARDFPCRQLRSHRGRAAMTSIHTQREVTTMNEPTDDRAAAARLDLDKLRTVLEQHEQAARDAEMAASAFRTLADDSQREAYRSRDVITTTVNAAILRWPDLSEQIEALEQSVLKAGEQR